MNLDEKRIARFCDGAVDVAVDQRSVDESFAAVRTWWQSAPLDAGDLVIIALPSGSHLLKHFLAVICAGGVPALVPPSLPTTRQRELVSALGARHLVGVWLQDKGLAYERLTRVGRLQIASFNVVTRHTSEGEVALLTSGSSGVSSACVLSFESLLKNAWKHANAVQLRSDDVLLVNLPLHYSYACVAQALAAMVLDAHIVVDGPPFNVSSYLSVIQKHRVTSSSLTPVLARKLIDTASVIPGSLRMLTVGGDVLNSQEALALLHRLGDRELYITYGLTEAGPRVSTLAAHEEPCNRLASVGRPLPGTRVAIDESRGPGDTGELLIHSDTLMKRRLGLLETAPMHHAWVNDMLATGDVFSQDCDGYLYFQGRISDMVVINGEKVNLASVRRLASTLPGVITAKTTTCPTDGPDAAYELTLYVNGRDVHATPMIRRQLATLLRRAELPAKLICLPSSDGQTTHYK